ncbi:MAG: hypothetical protein M4579_002450 [Chaenotheca gracillima]|nr:MAG: hypothetical protein M4579_002450 [Chaenotheca gracillima]
MFEMPHNQIMVGHPLTEYGEACSNEVYALFRMLGIYDVKVQDRWDVMSKVKKEYNLDHPNGLLSQADVLNILARRNFPIIMEPQEIDGDVFSVAFMKVVAEVYDLHSHHASIIVITENRPMTAYQATIVLQYMCRFEPDPLMKHIPRLVENFPGQKEFFLNEVIATYDENPLIEYSALRNIIRRNPVAETRPISLHCIFRILVAYRRINCNLETNINGRWVSAIEWSQILSSYWALEFNGSARDATSVQVHVNARGGMFSSDIVSFVLQIFGRLPPA